MRNSSPRDAFALTGPSVTLDPLSNAVRRDLADVRLADRVFAPHYAAPVAHRLLRETALHQGREASTSVLATLSADETFEVLDLVADRAWGVAPGAGRVGWIDRQALGAAA
jgi:hypothetical protein